jgi:Arc/MetJ family transcription regulator
VCTGATAETVGIDVRKGKWWGKVDVDISKYPFQYLSMSITLTSIRLDTKLADEAKKLLGVKSRSEAVHVALRELVALKRLKALMKKNGGKLSFDALDD